MDDDFQKIEKFKLFFEKLSKFSYGFSLQVKNIKKISSKKGLIEFAYIEHFENEMRGLLQLVQYLLKDDFNKKYIFFALRASLEALLYLEHVLRLAGEDRKNILSLLSKDVAQTSAMLDKALTEKSTEDHLGIVLSQFNFANKIMGTGFEMDKVKSNTKVFPSIFDLCSKSKINIKDLRGESIYSIYALYSESNHLRLASQHSLNEGDLTRLGYALEFYIEIYIKFYQQIIDTNNFDSKYNTELEIIKKGIGLAW